MKATVTSLLLPLLPPRPQLKSDCPHRWLSLTSWVCVCVCVFLSRRLGWERQSNSEQRGSNGLMASSSETSFDERVDCKKTEREKFVSFQEEMWAQVSQVISSSDKNLALNVCFCQQLLLYFSFWSLDLWRSSPVTWKCENSFLDTFAIYLYIPTSEHHLLGALKAQSHIWEVFFSQWRLLPACNHNIEVLCVSEMKTQRMMVEN